MLQRVLLNTPLDKAVDSCFLGKNLAHFAGAPSGVPGAGQARPV